MATTTPRCRPIEIGDTPAPLVVRLVAGMPATITVPVDGPALPSLTVEWGHGGETVAAHDLAWALVGDETVWSVALTATQVDALAGASQVRLVAATGAQQRVIAAGWIDWLTGWTGGPCTTRTPPLRVVGVPGPQGEDGPPGVSITGLSVDGDGVITVTLSDASTLDGGTVPQVVEAIEAAARAEAAAQLAGVRVTPSPDHPGCWRIAYPAYMSPAPGVVRLPIGQ